MSMKPCKCGNSDKKAWSFSFNDETRKISATCKKCGIIIEFFAKPRKPVDPNKIEACAEYEIRNNEHWLKINNAFVKVDIFKVNKKGQKDLEGKFLRVMPV